MVIYSKVADTWEESQACWQHRRTDISRSKTAWIRHVQVGLHCCRISALQMNSSQLLNVQLQNGVKQTPLMQLIYHKKKEKKPVTERIQSVFTGQLRTSSMAATGSLLYRRHWLYGGERVLVKALPATWWEIPARPQHLHGSAET